MTDELPEVMLVGIGHRASVEAAQSSGARSVDAFIRYEGTVLTGMAGATLREELNRSLKSPFEKNRIIL